MGPVDQRTLNEAAWRFAGQLYLAMAMVLAVWTVIRGTGFEPVGLVFLGGCVVGWLLPRVAPWRQHPDLAHWLNVAAATGVQAAFVPYWYRFPPLLLLPTFGALFVAATARRRWILVQMAPALAVLSLVAYADGGARVAVADTALYGVLWASLGLVSAWLRSQLDLAMADLVAAEQERHKLRFEGVQAIVDSLPLAISWKDTEGRFLGANSLARADLETLGATSFVGRHITDLVPEPLIPTFATLDAIEQRALHQARALTEEVDVPAGTGPGAGPMVLRFTAAPYTVRGARLGVVTSGEDVTETRELQRALATQGRMESIGQLAAGVAHEINTPVQFVSDNTKFLSSSFRDLLAATARLAELAAAHDGDAVRRVQDEADIDFISDEAPQAIDQCLEGLARVARIVGALKEFSHPSDDIEETDLNRVITSTVDVSRNEWKYVADLDLDLDPDLPPVRCSQGRLKQVVLNMIVNAAHAIEDRHGGRIKGRITVATSIVDDHAQIMLGDDGIGMEPHVRDRIFDQFYTTKDVGRGTGQGLSLAWDVVQAHNGSIAVDSTPGRGTTFTIRLPLHQGQPDPNPAPTSPEPNLADDLR